jgi:hypothetical protein
MSVIRVDNFGPSAGGTTYSARGIAKAWVNFNGTGTIAARDSENVSSLTDNGTGDYTVNFTNAMGNGNYMYSVTVGDASLQIVPSNFTSFPKTTTSIRAGSRYVSSLTGTAIADDADDFCVSIHGDLA